MPPEKIDSLADDVKALVLELLRQNSELTARVDELALLSQPGEKVQLNQGKHPGGLHYMVGTRRGAACAAVMRGGGCGGKVSLSWWARSFWSGLSSV